MTSHRAAESEEIDDRHSTLIPDTFQSTATVSVNGHEPNESNSNGHLDTYFSDAKVHIPDRAGLSFRKLWAFTGPGFLMSIAYLDPGNIESDLQSGSVAKYHLLWVLMLSTLAGLTMQRLAARLGVVSGHHLAEVCYRQYKKYPRILLWVMVEIAIIGSDMQEVIGTAISIYLLSRKVVPLWAGTLLAIVDAFTFLMLEKYGIRKLECLFGFLITVMALTFGYEYVKSEPNQLEVIEGLFIPWCPNCNSDALQQAIGIIGAVISPHNLYLHSALVKSREVDVKNKAKVRDANMYFFIESSIALLVSLVINVFVLAVFAHGFYEKKNYEILEMCNHTSLYDEARQVFPNDTHVAHADLYKGGIFLGCAFGTYALYVWAVGLLAAGSSSTMTGTYAGQFAMEGFLDLQWARWKRVLVTRTVAILPTFCVAYFSEISEMTKMNNMMNTIMSLQLPFAFLPAIALTSSVAIMGEFVNGIASKIVSVCIFIVVVAINILFVVKELIEAQLQWEWFILIGIVSISYILFIIYLTIHMVVCMAESLSDHWIVRKYFVPIGSTNGHEDSNISYSRMTDTD